jgi:type IV secretory pathway TraG/TraD family ATPase VirD4
LSARLPFGEEERVQDYLATLTPDQLSAVRGLATRLAIVSESETGAFLCPRGGADVVDVRRGLAGQEVILFSLNSSTYGKLAAQVGTLVVQDLIAGVGHRLAALGPAAVRGIVAVDEFSALGAENVLSLIARGREAGTGLLLSTQELADLDRAARGLREQVLGSTAVKIIHRQDVPASAQTIAQIAGTAHTWEETRQIGGGLFGSSASGRGTLRPVEKFLVHPNEIKRLPTGAAVVITKTPQARVQKVRVAAPDVMKGRLAGTARGASHQRGPELA